MHADPQLLEVMNSRSAQRILIFSAQPLDECAAAQDLLSLAESDGAVVRIVWVTDGPSAVLPQGILADCAEITGLTDGRWSPQRRDEAYQLLSELGVDRVALHAWDFPAGTITERLTSEGGHFLQSIKTELEEFKPTLVVSPSRLDRDPDRNSIGMAVAVAIEQCTGLASEHLSYVLQGPMPALPADHCVFRRDGVRQPLTQGRATRRLEKTRLTTPYIRNEASLYAGTLFCAFKNDCRMHVPLENSRQGRRVWFYAPSVPVQQACVEIKQRIGNMGRLGLRQADVLFIDEDDAGFGIQVGNLVDPLWLKIDQGETGEDSLGWQRLLPAPEANPLRTCAIMINRESDPLDTEQLEKLSREVDTLVIMIEADSKGLATLKERVRGYPNVTLMLHYETRPAQEPLFAALRFALHATDCGVFVILDGPQSGQAVPLQDLVLAMQRQDAKLALGEAGKGPADAASWSERLRNLYYSLLYPGLPRRVECHCYAIDRRFALQILNTLLPTLKDPHWEIFSIALEQNGVVSVPFRTRKPATNAALVGPLSQMKDSVKGALSRHHESGLHSS